jgi:4-amino-4-deoxy-L-arabinose transferase-like glycosyltransferase
MRIGVRPLLAGAMTVSFALVVIYVAARGSHPLAGDQTDYDTAGRYFADGQAWWSTRPFDVGHASAWKAPLYPLWVGLWYSLFGPHPVVVELIQALLAPLTVLLTWMLARRLFDERVAIVAACIVALFPLAWEFYGLLYSEALTIPVTLGVLLMFLGRGSPSNGRAAAVGAAIGIALLIRPSSGFLLVGALAAWIVAAGWRRALRATLIALAGAVVVIAPWTVRNVATDGIGFVPLSVQDGAAYGTFNSTSANDPVYPYAWRPAIADPPDVLINPPATEADLRSGLQDAAFDYIADHPFSVAEAFFWNGLSRFWDVRRPARALDEVPFEGRSEAVTAIGLGIYYVLLIAAIVALWRLRRRREVVIPLLAMALACSLIYTSASGTRYRAPLEPLIAILAASVVASPRAIRASTTPAQTTSAIQAPTASGT